MDATLAPTDLLDEVPCGIVSCADDGTIRQANATLHAMLGHAPGTLVGGSVEAILTVSSRIFFQTHLFPLLKLHSRAEEIFLTLKASDGQHVPVLTSAARRSFKGECVSHYVFIPVRQRQQYEQEILEAKRAAEEALHSNRELVEAREQLERHALELDRRVNLLEQHDKDLTLLASILSHDLREPIRKVSVFADIVRSDLEDALTPAAEHSLAKIGLASRRMDAIVGALRQYLSVHLNEGRLEQVDLNQALASAQDMLRAERKPPPFELVAAPLPVVEGYRRQLVALFYHLLDNAVKFRRPDRTLQVRVEGAVVQHNRFRSTRDRYKYADFVQLVVADNGSGFDKQYAEYVFGMLRRIDPDVPGLGLGLALCRKIAENHHGWISADAEAGNGATFTILLSARQNVATAADS